VRRQLDPGTARNPRCSKGSEVQSTCRMARVRPLTDDPDMRDTLDAAVNTYF